MTFDIEEFKNVAKAYTRVFFKASVLEKVLSEYNYSLAIEIRKELVWFDFRQYPNSFRIPM